MRSLTLTLFVALLSVSLFSFQAQTDALNTAIKSGNSRAVAAHFGAKIDLALPAQEGSVTKTQAEAQLRRFFAAHAPTAYSVMHQSKTKTGLAYSIGTLTTENGNFRVSVYTTKTEEKTVVQQFRIEAE